MRDVYVFGIGITELLIIIIIILVLSGGGFLPFVVGYFLGKNRGEHETPGAHERPAPPSEDD